MNCNGKKRLKLFWPSTVLCGTDNGTYQNCTVNYVWCKF